MRRKYADLDRGLREVDNILTTILTNAFAYTTLLSDNIRSVILAQLKRTSNRDDLLRALAALNDLGVNRRGQRQQARQTAEEVVHCVSKGVLEDCIAEFLRQGQGYLELVRQWEFHTVRAIDETFWKKLTPERVYLTEEEAMELSERLMEIEKKFGSNRKFLATTLRNVRQLYTLYTARRNFILQRTVRYALYLLRNSKALGGSQRLEIAGIAILYAYRSWCASRSTTFISLVRTKVKEVLRRLLSADASEPEDLFLVSVKSVKGDEETQELWQGSRYALVNAPPVELVPDEVSLQPMEDVLENQRLQLWRHERLLDYCSRLSVDDKRLLAFGFGYVDPLYLEALVDADRDWLPELLRQYIAKFHHQRQT